MEAQSRESRVEPDYFETLPGPSVRSAGPVELRGFLDDRPFYAQRNDA